MRMLPTIMRISNSVRALCMGALVIAAGAAGASTAAAGTGDIVLHARSATTRGAWSLVNDTTAADGVRLSNPTPARRSSRMRWRRRRTTSR